MKAKTIAWICAGIAILSLIGNAYLLFCGKEKRIAEDRLSKDGDLTILLQGNDRVWEIQEFSNGTFATGWTRKAEIFSFLFRPNGGYSMVLNNHILLDRDGDGIADEKVDMQTKKTFLQQQGKWVEQKK